MGTKLCSTALYGIINKETGKLKSVIINDPNVATWKSMTKLMLDHFSPSEIFYWLDECIIETSDKQWKEKLWLKEKSFPKRDFDYKQKRKSVIKLDLRKSKIRKQINDNLKITEVAKQYGIILKGQKAPCIFHEDKEPSLTFYDKTNTFKCYGCNAKGDVIEFIRRCENQMPKM